MILYLVMKVTKWEDMRFDKDIFRLQKEPGDYGYCPVFTDYDMAVKVAGGKEYVRAIKAGDKP